MKIQIENNSVYKDSLKIKEFDFPIKEFISLKHGIAILLHGDYYKNNNENIFFIDYEGKIVWQIPPIKYIYNTSPYVGLTKENEESFWATNWDGTTILIDTLTGKIVRNEWAR